MCCQEKEFWKYIVEWCAGWIPTYEEVTYKFMNPDQRTYLWTEDFVTYVSVMPAGWVPVPCSSLSNNGFDDELTCVQENSDIYIIRFEPTPWTYFIYDFNGVDVTWTVTPTQCEDTEVTSDTTLVCDSWTELYRHAVMSNWVPTWDVYYTDVNTWVITIPSGLVTAWQCPSAPAVLISEWEYVELTNINALTVVTMPTFDVTEVEILSTNPNFSFEVIMTTSTGWTITHLVPVSDYSTYSLELPSDAWFITALSINPAGLVSNVTINFYWYT